MSITENTQNVVVTDIRMPFWSMVVFMVKWAIAAIPALFLLAAIGFLLVLVFTAATSSITHRSSLDLSPQVAPSTSTRPGAKALEYTGPLADRCKGSYEPAKCMEAERQLLEETPEQRTQRQLQLETQRRQNLEKIGK